MSDPILIALARAEAAFLQSSFASIAGQADLIALHCDPCPGLSARMGGACLALTGVEKVGRFPAAYDVRRPELTEDMAQTIVRCFDAGQKDGFILIESNPRGLWLTCPHGIRLFIGLARLPDAAKQPARQIAPKAAIAVAEP